MPSLPVDNKDLGPIQLMKEQETFIKSYFSTCFCPRKFDELGEWLEPNYRAYIPITTNGSDSELTPESSPIQYKIIQPTNTKPDSDFEPLKSILTNITKPKDSDSVNQVLSCSFHPLDDGDRVLVEKSEAWIEQINEASSSNVTVAEIAAAGLGGSDGPNCGSYVEDWLCKAEVVVGVLNESDSSVTHKKLWLFNKNTGKLAASWPFE